MSRRAWLQILFLAALCSAGCGESPDTPPEPDWNVFPTGAADTVRAEWERAQQNPANAGALAGVARRLHAYEQYSLAAAYYARAAEADPQDARWPYLRGVAQFEAGDGQAAEAAFRETLRLLPGAAEARLRLAGVIAGAGGAEEAEELYRSVLQIQPGSATAHYGLGQIAAAQGRDAGAIQQFQQACGLAPWFSSARYALAQALLRSGEAEAGRLQMELFERRPKINEAMSDPLVDEVRSLGQGVAPAHLARGKRLEELGQLREAIEEYEKALAVDASYAAAHVNLMSAYGALGDEPRAETHYEQAVALGSQAPELPHNMGVMRARSGRWREAIPYFEEALRRDPGFADALSDLGYCLEQTGHVADARERYEQALEVEPYHRQASYHLGRVLLAGGKPKEAAQRILRAVDPDDGASASYLLTLAEAQLRGGEPGMARRSLERAARLADGLELKDIAAAARAALGRIG